MLTVVQMPEEMIYQKKQHFPFSGEKKKIQQENEQLFQMCLRIYH